MPSPKTKSPSAVPFRLSKIQTLQFALLHDAFNPERNVEISQRLNFSIDKENQQVAVEPHYQFFQIHPFIIVEVRCIFNIPDSYWKKWMNERESLFILPKNVATHMAVLSVGTTRGVLHAKTEGTIFNMFVLPTWNLAEIIKEDWVVNFHDE